MAKKISKNSVISAERVRSEIQSRFNPIRNVGPTELATYLDQFKYGYLSQVARVWEAIEERDDTLISVIPKRKSAVGRHGWEILTIETEDKSKADEHKEALDYFWNNITVTEAIDENVQGEVRMLARQMMDAVGKRYAVHEILWQPGEDGLTASFRFVPLWFFENTTGKLRFLATQNALQGVEMDLNQWLVSVATPLMPACSVAWMYKNLSLKDWVVYNEKHGMPGIHATTDAQEGTDSWNNLVSAVESFANDWAMVTNAGAEIKPIDISAKGELPFPPLVERMSRAIASIWRGADLSTMSAGVGDGSGASLQGSETDLLESDDATWISETLSRQIDRKVIEYTFGPGVKPLAYFKLKTATKKDTAQDIQIDRFLIDTGVPQSKKALMERYNRPVPDGDDDVTAPVPSAGQGLVPPGVMRNSNARRPAKHLPGASSANRFLRLLSNDTAVPESYIEESVQTVAKATEADLKPIRERIEYIMSIDDPELRDNALKNLQAELPKFLKQINADPAAAKAMEEVLSGAMLNGLTGGRS